VATVTRKPTRDPLPTIYDVHSQIVGKGPIWLAVTFRLRRSVRLGAQALRAGRVVSSTPLFPFSGHAGRLVLRIDPRRFPTGLRFITDAPTVILKNPGARLTGTVTLTATAKPYPGRRIVSVSFEYSRSGKGLWTTIATATKAPYRASLSTRALPQGHYDLRAVASDNLRVSGVSAVAARRAVSTPGTA
jgi:hypothetical protein